MQRWPNYGDLKLVNRQTTGSLLEALGALALSYFIASVSIDFSKQIAFHQKQTQSRTCMTFNAYWP